MFMKVPSSLLLIIILVFLSSCAKRGTPDGGPLDENPPEIVREIPKNNSIYFNDEKIRIFFDEYIKLEKLNSQLVVSPPIDKSKYSIFPQGGASKYIDIEINESLADSTTYVFNFGQSIQDNNEGNKLQFYKYAFSTGSYIDSLEVDGIVKDSYSAKTDELITVMLYPENEKFYDSIIYKEKPTYVASTLDSTYFNFTNVKTGKYHLIAIKDNNNNFLFDPLIDKIAYYDSIINLPGDYEIDLKIFKENPEFFIFKPFQTSYNKLSFGYRGNTDSLDIKISNKNFINSSQITFEKETDTLNFWFKEFEYDTIYLDLKNKNFKEKFKVSYPRKKLERDSLQINSDVQNSIDLGEKFILNSNIPLSKIDDQYINIYNKDSVGIEFSTRIKNGTDIIFDFEILPNDKYNITVLPNAIIDFFDNTVDTLNYSLNTKKSSDYGLLIVNIETLKKYPIIVELLDTKEDIIQSKYIKSQFDECIFENINPGDYNLRLIHDKNENYKWDSGNYLNKIKPEETLHSLERIKIRANWVIREKI